MELNNSETTANLMHSHIVKIIFIDSVNILRKKILETIGLDSIQFQFKYINIITCTPTYTIVCMIYKII